jgi:CheY-like chemotaxis protein
MHTSSRFMLQLVNQFLDVAKIESGRLDLYLEPTDLHSLFRDAVDLNRVLAERKAVALEYAFDSIPETMADRGKLVQVLNNLVSNAVKYAPAESTVQVGLRRHGDGAVLSVADQGQGIAAEDVERIFRVFTRLDDGDGGQDPEHSVGLGLAIVKRIVQGHGGRLWLESEPGRGTTFFALIPLVEPREREQAPTPPPEPEAPAGAGRTGEEPPEAPAAGRTVMVVDDERINAHIVLRLLHKAGHHGVWAASGRACLELLRGRPCDLVFMDVQMAGMDGVETLRRIRAGEAGEAAAAIPVAGLTGHTDPETRRRLLDAGMVAVLAKPVDAAGLLEAVEEHAADPGEGGR